MTYLLMSISGWGRFVWLLIYDTVLPFLAFIFLLKSVCINMCELSKTTGLGVLYIVTSHCTRKKQRAVELKVNL